MLTADAHHDWRGQTCYRDTDAVATLAVKDLDAAAKKTPSYRAPGQ